MGEDASPPVNSGPKSQFDAKGWVGILIGAAGLIAGYIYYLWTISSPEVSWWSTNQIVFSAESSNPDIRLLDRTGAQIDHDVYALNLSVSNTGTALLERANDVNSLVRSPLAITLPQVAAADEEARIISASIVALSEQPPVKLTCELIKDGVSINWEHLDPRTGFRVLMLYTALHQLTPAVAISIVGTRGPTHVVLAPRVREVEQGHWWWVFIVPLGFAVVGAISAIIRNALEKTRLFELFERLGASLRTRPAVQAIYTCLVLLGAITVVLLIVYRTTLLGFWQNEFPPNEPPLAVETPVPHAPCSSS